MFKTTMKLSQLRKNQIFVNSSWGMTSQVFQSILLSLFFILIARHYATEVFANFIIATVLYQLLSAFSSLGLSQWFIREITGTENKKDLIYKFFKIQIYSGVTFYLLNIILGFLLYDDKIIHVLAILLGINIIFDNFVNAIKCINISEFKQEKTFIILTIDAFLKFATACFLYVYPLSIITLAIILVIVKFATLNLFLRIGSSRLINVKSLYQYKISLNYLKHLLILNWPFIIIGAASIINWRTAAIIISVVLSPGDVANYEISYKIFSVVQLLPIVVATTFFPILINLFKEDKIKELSAFYKKVHKYYLLFGLFCFTFIYSFADFLIPAIFGVKYVGTEIYTKEMFLTILVFPTSFLQANVLVAMKREKLDMWFNVVLMIINVTFCIIGAYFFKSLNVIIISIFLGFVVFHILQDIVLIKKKISSVILVIEFYGLSIASIISYIVLEKLLNHVKIEKLLNQVVLFSGYWIAIFSLYFLIKKLRGGFKHQST